MNQEDAPKDTKVSQIPTPDSTATESTTSVEPEIKAEPPVQATKPVKKGFSLPKNKKVIYALIAFICLLIIVIAILVIFLILSLGKDNKKEKEGETGITPTPSVEVTATTIPTETVIPTPTTTPVAEVDKNRILYSADNNLWVVNNDGSGKKQVTTDGNGTTVRYTTFDWRSPGVVSYAKCASECKIYTKKLSDMTEQEILSAMPFTQTIQDISWSHDGNILGYIFVKGDDSSEATLWKSGSETVLKSFAPPPARGGGYNDGIDIIFSPSDLYVIVFDTIINPPTPTISVFKPNGTELLTIEEGFSPTFDEEDSFYYISDGNIKEKTIGSAGVSNVYTSPADYSIYNIRTSPNKYYIAFWSIRSSDMQVSLNYYDTGGSPSMISTGFANAEWLNDDTLVAIKTETNIEGMGYTSQGLVTIKRMSGDVVTLETKKVYSFEIE